MAKANIKKDDGGVAVMDRPPEAIPDTAPGLGTSVSASVLIDHLKESGTPFKPLEAMRKWARDKDNQNATAEDLYRHLEAEGSKEGTLRKAGRFCFGPEFEPASVVSQAPEEEITRLREENERLRTTAQNASAEKLGLMNQNTHLHARVNELQSQVQYLKVGKTADELKAAGL